MAKCRACSRTSIRCPIFVDDLADALIELTHLSLRAAERRSIPQRTLIDCFVAENAPRNDKGVSIINIAGPQRLSRYDFGVKLARAFLTEIKFQPALSASFPSPRPRDCALDISLARRILKTRLRSVDEVMTLM